MTFLDALELIFTSFGSVIDAIDVPLFTLGSVDISLWNLLLGGLICFIIFSFFLRSRGGSGWEAAGNMIDYDNAKSRAESRRLKAEARARYRAEARYKR